MKKRRLIAAKEEQVEKRCNEESTAEKASKPKSKVESKGKPEIEDTRASWRKLHDAIWQRRIERSGRKREMRMRLMQIHSCRMKEKMNEAKQKVQEEMETDLPAVLSDWPSLFQQKRERQFWRKWWVMRQRIKVKKQTLKTIEETRKQEETAENEEEVEDAEEELQDEELDEEELEEGQEDEKDEHEEDEEEDENGRVVVKMCKRRAGNVMMKWVRRRWKRRNGMKIKKRMKI